MKKLFPAVLTFMMILSGLTFANAKGNDNSNLTDNDIGTQVKIMSEAEEGFDADNIVLRFGVVSDVHQNGYYAGKITSAQAQEWTHVIDVFQKTAAKDGAVLDAILVNGDLVDGISNNGSNVGSFKNYGDKALQNMREAGFFAHGVWGADNGIEFTETKKVSDETQITPASYKEATAVYGRGNGFDDTTKLFYVLGNHDENGRGKSTSPTKTLDGQSLKFSTVYSADYFGAVICGWQHNPDSDEAKTNSIGGTGTYQDGFEHSYRSYFADLIDYNTNPATAVTKEAFEANYGVKLESADALFDKYYGHLDFETTLTDTKDGIRFGNSHMTIDPNPDNGTANDRIHFIGVELSMTNDSCAWAEEIIKTSVAEDPSKPIFMITHYKMPDTMIGDQSNTRLQSIIKNYPQVIIWGGHSHTTMHTDNAINSEQGYVAVETNTTRYMSTTGSLTVYAKFGKGTSNSKDYPNTPYNYPSNEASVSNGCYVEVDKNNNVRINRVDIYRSFSEDYAENPSFYTQSKYTNFNSHKYNPSFRAVDRAVFIREPWDIVGIGSGKHLADFNTTERKTSTKTPYFRDASSVSAQGVIGGLNVTMTLNAVDDDGMVMLYVLEIKDADGNVAHRRYYTNFFYEFPQSDATLAGNDIAVRTETALVTGLDQEKEYTISLFPVDEYYIAGEAISTSATTLPGKNEVTLEDGRIGVFVDTTGETLIHTDADGINYPVYNTFESAIATGADVLYVIKSTHAENSLRDSIVAKQKKALEIVGIAQDRNDTILSWQNAVYLKNYDLTLTHMGLNKGDSGDTALHVYNGHTLTLNSCLSTNYSINIFTAYNNQSKTGNLRITGDTSKINNIWTNSTYSKSNTYVTGDTTLTLEGGTYITNVHFMKLASSAENPFNKLDGNLYINVSGGTFQKALRGSTPDSRAIITKNSVVTVTGGTIAELGNTGTSYVEGKEVYIVTDAVLATTTYTTSKKPDGTKKSILITIPANEGGIGEATLDESGYITSFAIKQVKGKNSFVNGVATTSVTLAEGENYNVTYKVGNTVTFDINDGEGTAPEIYTGITGEVYSSFPDGTGFAKENHYFLGWALTDSATETIDSVTIPAEGITLYAVWKPKERAVITLDAGEGTVSEAAVEVFRGDETLLPLAYKQKTVFAGWSETSGATAGSYTYTVPHDVEAVTLYAVYKEVDMDVIYVDTTAQVNGDGRTSLSPKNDWVAAMKAGSASGTKYVIMTPTVVSRSATVTNSFSHAKGALWITNIDPVTGNKYNSAAIFAKNGHYTSKDVTFDIPMASLEHDGMHMNFGGHIARFTSNASFVAKGDPIPGMPDAVSSSTFSMRGGNDGGSFTSTNITFDNLNTVSGNTVYASSQYGGKIDNVNVTINDGTLSSKTINLSAKYNDKYSLIEAGNINVVVNGYSATGTITFKASYAEAISGAVNLILNNDVADMVTLNYSGTAPAKGKYLIKSAVGGQVTPTETAGVFKIVSDSGVIMINGTKVQKSQDNLYALSGSADGVYVVTYTSTEKDVEFTVKLAREKGTKPYCVTYDDGTEYNNHAVIEIYREDTLICTFNEDTESEATAINVFASLESGAYRIEITKNGYLKYTEELIVGTEDIILPEIKLIPGDIKATYTDRCGDGVIDIDDFTRVLRGLSTTSEIKVKHAVDINEDGIINVTDLGYIKTNFGIGY